MGENLKQNHFFVKKTILTDVGKNGVKPDIPA